MQKVKEKLTTAMSLPKEIALDLPIVTIVGKREVFVENFKNLLEFTDKKIRLRLKEGVFILEGEGLMLKQVTNEHLLVNGLVASISYE